MVVVVDGKFYKVRGQNFDGFGAEWYNPISWFDTTDKFATDLFKSDRQIEIEQRNAKFYRDNKDILDQFDINNGYPGQTKTELDKINASRSAIEARKMGKQIAETVSSFGTKGFILTGLGLAVGIWAVNKL
jgi:hypothetical protein